MTRALHELTIIEVDGVRHLPIPGFTGSFGSIDGASFVSINAGYVCQMSIHTNDSGYKYINLARGCGLRPKAMMVHRLVWIINTGSSVPDGMQVNHKDLDKSNNDMSNLEIVTCRENIRHAIANGAYTDNYMSRRKISDDKAFEIRCDYAAGLTYDQICESHGLGRSLVGGVISGKLYKWVPFPENFSCARRIKRLTGNDIEKIVALGKSGMLSKEIAIATGMKVSTIDRVRRDHGATRADCVS